MSVGPIAAGVAPARSMTGFRSGPGCANSRSNPSTSGLWSR
ncbi:hypothetical protein I553_3116 [Mycobacterium xenopi 4042]|uniref:Uncharacterized protein n=1 Tax=Mycobacterium xenopi 4042 TaxID=1299334 RepID=X8E3N6_MYCXE|nr:hypothetical protein I552_0794 [Mycobacterium xenopi 3993]EUA75224.1 hypothetical protein I553_3116 [Mycobacterium xenopi 4042]